MPQKFRFLCENFNNQSNIYATKFGKHPWHYFEDQHCMISLHESLPVSLKNLVKTEFSQLHFTSDWATVKTMFITKYSLPFIENKKKEMSFTFSDEPNLRSFVNRKFTTFKKYTTLPLINQMEIILNDLPADIAHLFMVNEKI